MDIHNLMEDVVSSRVNKLYEQLKSIKPLWLTCDCENCRLDTISYVLNRIQPKYVVSGRGALYGKEALKDFQQKADIDALGLEGIRIVSMTKRPFHSEPRENCKVEKTPEPAFNFPTIQGVALDGTTFEPLVDATVKLTADGKEVPMADMTWANPVQTYASTKGTYCFWSKPLEAEKADISRKFTFTLEISKPEYDSVFYSFETTLVSDGFVRNSLNSSVSLKIMDLVLFKSEIKNPMENNPDESHIKLSGSDKTKDKGIFPNIV